MARAKRTERAEARRRYRATLATDPLAEDADDADASASGSSQGAKRSNAAPAGKQGSSGTPERVGFLDAFKLSIRPVHVRQDIAALPWITHPHEGDLAAGPDHDRRHDRHGRDRRDRHGDRPAVHLLRRLPGHRRGLHRRLPRTAGQLARRDRGRPRVGRLLRRAGRCGPAARAPFGEQFAANPTGAAVSAFIYSPIMGAFFAAAAAWYRRFLALSSPNRNRRQSQAQKQRPGDGRTRGGTSQKAPAKR